MSRARFLLPTLAFALLAQAHADLAFRFDDGALPVKALTYNGRQLYEYAAEELETLPPGGERAALYHALALLCENVGAFGQALGFAKAALQDFSDESARPEVERLEQKVKESGPGPTLASLPAEKLEKSEPNYGKASGYIQEELEKNPGPERKALLLYGLATLYENVGDLREARNTIREAHALCARAAPLPDDMGGPPAGYLEIAAMRERLDLLMDPKDTPAEALRKKLRRRGLSFDLSLGLEHDTNVILEQVNPTRPTDKEDSALVVNAGVTQRWMRKPGRWATETFYNYYDAGYFRFEDLDSTSHTAGQSLLWNRPLKGGQLSGAGRLSFTQFESAGRRLLWNWGLAPALFYFQPARRLLWSAAVSWRDTAYFPATSRNQEGTSWDLSLGLTRYLDKASKRSAGLSLEHAREEPRQASLRYDQSGATLQAQLRAVRKWRPDLSAKLRWYKRDYDAASAGQPRRSDEQTALTLSLSWRWFKNHSLEVKAGQVGNRSNIAANHYEKQIYGLSYGLKL